MTDDPYAFDWDGLYDPDYLYFYSDTFAVEDAAAQVDRVCRALSLKRGSRVLDLGCGHGRHAVELALRGHLVTGVDRSEYFIDRARRFATDLDVAIDFRVEDLRALEDVEGYDAALMLFDVFGAHSDGENLDVLRRVRRSLEPGGGFCLDLRNRDWVVRAVPPVTVLQKGDDLMVDRHGFDPKTGRLVDHRTLVRDGRVREVRFSVRLYSFTEVKALLESAGFEVTDVWGSWEGAPLTLATNRMVVFARAG